MAEAKVTEGVSAMDVRAQTVSELARLSEEVIAPRKRLLSQRRIMAAGMSVILATGIRLASYTDQQRAAFAPPPGCELESKESSDWIEHELQKDYDLRVERGQDKTVLTRFAGSARSPHGSSIHSVLEYLLLVDDMELHQNSQLSKSGINVNLYSNEAIELDNELLDELWQDTLSPGNHIVGLQRTKFACHHRNFFELRNHEGKDLNIRVAVTGKEDTRNYGFVFRDSASAAVNVRFLVREVTDLNRVGFIAHEFGVHATEWFDGVPMLPRLRALENVANEVEDEVELRWGTREFELFRQDGEYTTIFADEQSGDQASTQGG